jgi:hypothetical protein
MPGGFWDQRGNWVPIGPRPAGLVLPCQCDAVVTGGECRPWCPGREENR